MHVEDGPGRWVPADCPACVQRPLGKRMKVRTITLGGTVLLITPTSDDVYEMRIAGTVHRIGTVERMTWPKTTSGHTVVWGYRSAKPSLSASGLLRSPEPSFVGAARRLLQAWRHLS